MTRLELHFVSLVSFVFLMSIGLASVRAQSTQSLTFSWNAPAPELVSEGLIVWYAFNLQLPDSSFQTTLTQNLSLTKTGLAPGTPYPYYIDWLGCAAEVSAGLTEGSIVSSYPSCGKVGDAGAGTMTTADQPSGPPPTPTETPIPTAAPTAVEDNSASASTCTSDADDPGGSGTISVSWDAHPPEVENPGSMIWYCVVTAEEAKATDETSITFFGLTPGEEYGWHVEAFSCVGDESMEDGTCPRITYDVPHAAGLAIARGGAPARAESGSSGSSSSRDSADAGPSPTPAWHDHNVSVTGSAYYQPLTDAGIGDPDILALGVISATNVWGMVPAGTRVCFMGQSGGGVQFKDSSTTPHPVNWLPHYQMGADTCVDIPGPGTVVLVRAASPHGSAAQPQPADQPPAPPAEPVICRIKVTDTLFLRAAPGGEIIALVWLNTEVPVYELYGLWYLVEFEGQFGYISRQHRTVLDGAC